MRRQLGACSAWSSKHGCFPKDVSSAVSARWLRLVTTALAGADRFRMPFGRVDRLCPSIATL